MISPLADGITQGTFRRYLGSAIDWLNENFHIPHSARATKFHGDNGPHLREPIEAACSMNLRKVVIFACTGAGKTTIMEAFTTFVVAVEPGPMLAVGQGDKEIEVWAKTRLKGCLKSCQPIRGLMEGMGRFDDTKDLISFPHMELHLGGANMSSLQEKSMRYTYGDEVWRWKKGMIRELLARHHDRWNRKSILVSQGCETNQDSPHDLVMQYREGDDRRPGFVCPSCGVWQRYLFANIKFDKTMIEGTNDLDYNAIKKTARYECDNDSCKASFPDNSGNRRTLSKTLSYRAFNSHCMEKVTSFTIPAWAVWWISWGDLVVEFLQAMEAKKAGDIEPLKQFQMKRAAEPWEEEYSKIDDSSVLSLRSDSYKKGECPIDPVLVAMFADPGQDATHWNVSAWAASGERYIIDYGICLGIDDLTPLALSLEYPIKGTDEYVMITGGLIDSGDFTEDVYECCLRSVQEDAKGSKTLLFFPSKGSAAFEGIKPWKETKLAEYGGLPLFIYVDRYAKDDLYGRKIGLKESPRLYFPSDASEAFMRGHMGQRKIGDHWQKVKSDHAGDCTKLGTVFWWIMKNRLN